MAAAAVSFAERDFQASLAALDAHALRRFLSELAAGVDHQRALVEFAAKALGGAPYLEPDAKLVDDAVRVARAGKRKAQHRGPEVRAILERARRLLLRGDRADARKAYETILGLAADVAGSSRSAALDDELDEAETGFPHAGSYLVSVYESAPAASRVDTMLDAVERLSGVDVISSPIALMIESAVRPLEGLVGFTKEWAQLLEAIAEGAEPGPSTWSPSYAMLAEALERLDGLDGIARAARRTGDLAQYRTWVMRVVAEGRFTDAISIASEAGESLADSFGRGLMLDAALTLAEKARDAERCLVLVERAFLADPSPSRLARWLLWGSPPRTVALERVAGLRANAQLSMTPRMNALAFALEGAVDKLVALLDRTDDGWSNDDNAGPLAFPALLVVLYGGPKATAVAARVCAPLFAGSAKAEVAWRGWSPPNSLFGEPSTPDPGPFIVSFGARRAGQGQRVAQAAADALRHAAAIRTRGVLESRERAAFDGTAALVVAAAESTLHIGQQDLARAYLGEVALAAAPHPVFRSALTKTLAKSTLVNTL